MNYRVIRDYASVLPTPEASSDRTIQPDDRILLLRMSAIGDAIRILPVVEYLRRNRFTGRIDCAVEPPIQQFLEPYPKLDNVYEIRLKDAFRNAGSILSLVRTLRRANYDWVFDVHGLLKSGILSFLTGSDRRVGYSREKSRELNYWFQNILLPEPLPPDMPRILKYLQMVRSFTEDYEFTRSLITPDYPEVTASGADLRSEAEQNPILVHPCTSHSRYGTRKEWGEEKFGRFLKRLRPEVDSPIRVTWGPGEREIAGAIADRAGTGVRIAAETRSLKDLAYQVRHARFVVSVDTSVSHVADLLGTPLVVLFGGSNHRIHAPLFTNYRYLVPQGDSNSTEELSVRTVLRATRDLLNSLD